MTTVQGPGASPSPANSGWIVVGFGARPAFIVLGSVSLAAVALWRAAAPMLRHVCDVQATRPS